MAERLTFIDCLFSSFISNHLFSKLLIGLTIWLSRYMEHELFKNKTLKKFPPFLDTWSDSSSPTYIFSPAQKCNFSLPHLHECCWYLECKRTWQPDEEAALKIRLSGGEPPFQSDEVVLLDS